MIVVIPVAEGRLSGHFGRSQAFKFFNVEDKNILSSEDRTPPPHEHGVYPKWLADEGAHVVIAGGMGAHSQELLRALNVEIVLGAQETDPELIVKSWLEGNLLTGDHSCTH